MSAPIKHRSERKLTLGLTLVELLVSLLLGVLLSGGIVSAYLGARKNYLYEEQMARMQENGRYAVRLLSRELEMAGFFGGIVALDRLAPAAVLADCSDRSWILDPAHPLELVNDYSGESPPVSLHATRLTCLDSASIARGTDLLAVKRTAGEASLYRGKPADGLTASAVESWYLRVNAGGSPAWEKLRASDLLAPAMAVPSRSYWEAISRIYFIRTYSEVTADAIPTLCMEALAGNEMTSRCLIEGVENVQLEFGIDTDADGAPNQYKSSPTAAELQRAVAAKVHLLIRSVNKVSGYRDGATYALGEKVIAAQHDSYLRRVFSTTVLLRNRLEPIG